MHCVYYKGKDYKTYAKRKAKKQTTRAGRGGAEHAPAGGMEDDHEERDEADNVLVPFDGDLRRPEGSGEGQTQYAMAHAAARGPRRLRGQLHGEWPRAPGRRVFAAGAS